MFKADVPNSKMFKGWTVNDVAVTNETKDAEGRSMAHYLADSLTVNGLSDTMNVSVELEDYVGYPLPSAPDAADYTISVDGDSILPGGASREGEVRDRGDVTFTMTPKASENDKIIRIMGLCMDGYDFTGGGWGGRSAPPRRRTARSRRMVTAIRLR